MYDKIGLYNIFFYAQKNLFSMQKLKSNQLLEQSSLSCEMVGTALFCFDLLLSQRLQFGAELTLFWVQRNFKPTYKGPGI